MKKYDFGGWATKYDVLCSDGRTISKEAFAHCNDVKVPLVWNHDYAGPETIIGHAILKHSDEGVYSYCEFNDSDTAKSAKGLVKHGDITSLSIYANKLKQLGSKVIHGDIKEVSLVLAGANPGASIQEVLLHGDEVSNDATIYNDPTGIDLEPEMELTHTDVETTPETELTHKDVETIPEKDTVTVAEVYNDMTDEQKAAVAIIIDQLSEDEEDDQINHNDKEDNIMKNNVFDNQVSGGAEMKHSECMAASIADIKKHGSLKESFIAHAGTYGINDIELLFPTEKLVNNEPILIDRDQTWVSKFFNATKKSPFSRLKTIYADITADDARAKGYTTTKLKKEEVFGLLKRVTQPTTIYKKQKLDRDDILDIVDFDVVAWMKVEMRGKLDEELARAMLMGDGRTSSSDDKVNESCIRPIYNDSDLFTIKESVGVGTEPKEIIKAVIKAMSKYEGKGIPSIYIRPSLLADMLLIEDTNGRFIYPDETTLTKTLRVKEIIQVPAMSTLVRTGEGTESGKTHSVLAIIVNPADYTVGADKGGQVAMFDDFDIDYNQQKYLIETRCSGSLLTPKTAITIERVV